MANRKLKNNNKKSKNTKKVRQDRQAGPQKNFVELTPDDEIEFIAQIRAYPILWERTNMEYRNTAKKGSICETIAEIYEMPCKCSQYIFKVR